MTTLVYAGKACKMTQRNETWIGVCVEYDVRVEADSESECAAKLVAELNQPTGDVKKDCNAVEYRGYRGMYNGTLFVPDLCIDMDLLDWEVPIEALELEIATRILDWEGELPPKTTHYHRVNGHDAMTWADGDGFTGQVFSIENRTVIWGGKTREQCIERIREDLVHGI